MTTDEIESRVKQILTTRLGMPPEQIRVDSSFEELGVDSLDFVELAIAAEREFDIEISDERLRAVRTVAEVVSLIADFINARSGL